MVLLRASQKILAVLIFLWLWRTSRTSRTTGCVKPESMDFPSSFARSGRNALEVVFGEGSARPQFSKSSCLERQNDEESWKRCVDVRVTRWNLASL